MKKTLFVAFAALLFNVTSVHISSAHGRPCPSSDKIHFLPLDNIILDPGSHSYAAFGSTTLDNENWSFALKRIQAANAGKAYQKARDALAKISITPAPESDDHYFMICHYPIHLSDSPNGQLILFTHRYHG